MTVHRLVQAVTVGELPDDLAAAWRQATRALIEAALPGEPHEPGNWPAYAALLPNAQAALTASSIGMGKVGNYLGNNGSYAAAGAILPQVLLARERELGAEHPSTLAARVSIAALTGTRGDPAGARDQYAALLPVMEQVLGPQHADTLTAHSEFAYWTGRVG